MLHESLLLPVSIQTPWSSGGFPGGRVVVPTSRGCEGSWGLGLEETLGARGAWPQNAVWGFSPLWPQPSASTQLQQPSWGCQNTKDELLFIFSPSCFPFSGISFVSACAHCLSCQDADGAGSWSTPNPTVWADRELCPAAGMEPAPCHGGNAPDFSPKPWGKCSKTILETNVQVLTPSRR